MCQDRYGLVDPPSFNRRSCTMCFAYLFPGHQSVQPLPPDMEHLVTRNISGESIVLPAEVWNQSTRDTVCEHLSTSDCHRWRSCCVTASECCQWQLEEPVGEGRSMCLRTWDGYQCWDDTPVHGLAISTCPHYVGYAVDTRRHAFKHCTGNGTWYNKKGLEWTDYTQCLDRQSYITGVYINLGCSAMSLLLLIPAISVFLVYRDLRRQDRIALHVNFFMSLSLSGIANICWFLLVHHDILVNPDNRKTVKYNNPSWCRCLSLTSTYLTSTTYFWMLCEGYYLHKLIARAFRSPGSLGPLIALGWVVPALPITAYGIVRLSLANDSCWSQSFGAYEWLIYAPNLACLIINLGFLCNILRILLFQLHSLPHEPSGFRRGVKAAFMLVPLFGLQMFLTVYRPPIGAPGERELEYLMYIMSRTQGFFVSLIYCFGNGEVLSHLRRTFCKNNVKSNLGTRTQASMCDVIARSPSPSLRSLTAAPPGGDCMNSAPGSPANARNCSGGYNQLSCISRASTGIDAQYGPTSENTQLFHSDGDFLMAETPTSTTKPYSPIPTIITTHA